MNILSPKPVSTGIAGLDSVLQGIQPGDNLVFHVDTPAEYEWFARPFALAALAGQTRVIYFRFAAHPPLLEADSGLNGLEIVALLPEDGFERFTFLVHQKIDQADSPCCYVFDSLSALASGWFSDLMVGNFFSLTAPSIFQQRSVAYFSFERGAHSFHATTPIMTHTQILLDVFTRDASLYILPRKVENRHATTMYMLHQLENGRFVPVRHSAAVTDLMRGVNWSWQDATGHQRGFWSKTFLKVEQSLSAFAEGRISREEVDAHKPLLLQMMVSRNSRVLGLARTYFEVEDLLWIRSRMLATGRLGGKTVGMLLARAILQKKFNRHDECIEPHDSFFVGTDLYCTALVSDGSWWLQQKRQSWQEMLDGAAAARERILSSDFPEFIRKRFFDMLNYFGQSPIIVRSSSLLEDNFGSAFAGKYDSVFLPNQGTPAERLESFMNAVKIIFASTLSEEALRYRQKRGILDVDEEMGLLVQRVSGCVHGNCFFPHLAGVGMSFNPYVWHESIDPHSGLLRLVFGLGTRAVDRNDDDHTRLVALNAPLRRAELTGGSGSRLAQRKVDVLDLAADACAGKDFETVVREASGLTVSWFARRDAEVEEFARHRGRTDVFSWVIDFDDILEDTALVQDMGAILTLLEQSYDYPLEVEFTVNFFSKGEYRINLVQCRPMQIHQGAEVGAAPELQAADILLQCAGPVIGRSRHIPLSRVIYVVPDAYAALSTATRYQVAEVIGRLTHLPETGTSDFHQLLAGPGRWGTTTPALGVPVTFAQINTVEVLCEIVAMSSHLVPDVSLGTHFFNELVEADMLYMAMFPGREGSIWQHHRFLTEPNQLSHLLPDCAGFENVIWVTTANPLADSPSPHFFAHAKAQKAIVYFKPE